MAKRLKTRYTISFTNIYGKGTYGMFTTYEKALAEVEKSKRENARDVAEGYVDIKAIYTINEVKFY